MAARRLCLLAAAAFAVPAGCGGGDAPPKRLRASTSAAAAAARAAAAPALAERLAFHLDALARAAREHDGNRAAGTPGGAASEDHVERALRAAGFAVRRQRVSFDQFVERHPPTLRRPGRAFRAPREIRTLEFSPAGTVTGRVRAVPGLGCRAADHRALRRGEVALVTRGTCKLLTKAQLAAQAGAAAVLIVNTPAAQSGGRRTYTGTLGGPDVDVPVLGVGEAVGADVRGRTVTLRVDATSGRLSAENVIADAPGGDPRRVVMVGAHLDSVGEGPGLNDNGSGVAAVLALAERLAAKPAPAGAARLRVAFWAAEELGSIGSREYVRRLSRAQRRAIRAYVNLDMVGSRNGAPFVYDSGNAIERRLRAGVAAAGLRPESTDIGGASDHDSFRRAGIAVGGVYSGSTERMSRVIAKRQHGRTGRPYDGCYHRACDRRAAVDETLARDLAAVTESAVRALRRR